MSNGYRNGAFALGVVVGGGLALNLFLWLDYSAHSQSDQGGQSYNDAGYSEIGQWWDRLIGTFVSPSDTLAQWIMAAFTVVAVLLVRSTLIATQEMARDTSRIGEAQVRAYISPVLVKVSSTADTPYISFRCDVANYGQSPATDAYALVKIHFFVDEGVVEHKLFHEIGPMSVGLCEGPTIGYGESKIPYGKFTSCGACHVQIRVIARDIFGKHIDGSGFFVTGGHPEGGVAYVISQKTAIPHDRLGMGLVDEDFAHVMPNWRKTNWGNDKD